jgi:hypothetical protein
MVLVETLETMNESEVCPVRNRRVTRCGAVANIPRNTHPASDIATG